MSSARRRMEPGALRAAMAHNLGRFLVLLVSIVLVVLLFVTIASLVVVGGGMEDDVNGILVGTLVFTAAATVISTVLVLLMNHYYIKPLHQAMAAARRVASGDFEARIETPSVHATPEVREFAGDFNLMASELGSTEMLRRDAWRRCWGAWCRCWDAWCSWWGGVVAFWQATALYRTFADTANSMRISFFSNMCFGAFKLVTGIMAGSVLIVINGLYNGVLCLSRAASLAGNSLRPRIMSESAAGAPEERPQVLDLRACARTGLAVVALGGVFVGFGIRTMVACEGHPMHMFMVLGLATCAFYKLPAAIVGLMGDRKRGADPLALSNRLVNLADGMASMVLTQSALLEMESTAGRFFWDGVAGIAVGVAIMGMGAYLTMRMRRELRILAGTSNEGTHLGR